MSSEEESEQMQFTYGSCFESFAEFEQEFEAWKAKTGSSYRIASSEKIKGDADLIETFRYRYVVFNCIHFGDPRVRGTGVRPNQSYLPCGCKSSIRLNYMPDEECMRILKFVGEHTGHQNMDGTVRSRAAFKRLLNEEKEKEDVVGEEEENAYAKQRQLVDNLKREQEQMLAILNSRRKQMNLGPFNPPPINADTLDFFRAHCQNEPLTRGENAELDYLTKSLLQKKSYPRQFQPLQQLQPIENDENRHLL